MPCPRCGYENQPDTRFCARCNCSLQAESNAYAPDNQMTVILPPAATPLTAAAPQAKHPASDEPLETIIIAKPAIPTAAPIVPAKPAAPIASPVGDVSMAPVIPASSVQPARHTLPETLQTVALEPAALASAHKAAVAPAQTTKPAPPPAPPVATAPVSSHEPEFAKQATNFSIAIGTASVVLLIVAVSYYMLELRGENKPEGTLPPVAISAPSPAVAASEVPPPPAAASPVAEVVVAPQSAVVEVPVVVTPPEAVSSTPVVAAETKTASIKPEAPPAAVSGPRQLNNAEVTALLKDLKKQKAPRDCAAANQMLVQDRNVLPRQADKIAKLAYPDLCAPQPKPVAEPAQTHTMPAKPAATVEAPAPQPKARTLDDLYEEKIGAECSKGAFGHICRETIRLKMCSGKLSDNPPPGQTVCKQ